MFILNSSLCTMNSLKEKPTEHGVSRFFYFKLYMLTTLVNIMDFIGKKSSLRKGSCWFYIHQLKKGIYLLISNLIRMAFSMSLLKWKSENFFQRFRAPFLI